jgi:urease accessory protein
MATAATTIDARADMRLLRLMQLVSPALPVGAFAYSQGLEWAIEAGWITNARQTLDWIIGVMDRGQGRLDIPVLAQLYKAWQDRDMASFQKWDRYLGAARGSAELQREDRHMGQALFRLLGDLSPDAVKEMPIVRPSYTAVFAVAACHWFIDLETACTGLLWSWAENQVAAAVKLVPLGQTQGQTLLMQIANQIPGIVNKGIALAPDDIGAVTPALSMASALHETQHTRLFRS